MKKWTYGLGTLLILAAFTLAIVKITTAQSPADLVAKSVKLKPAVPEVGVLTTIRAFIANEGGEDVNDAFDIAFEIDGTIVGQRSLTRLGANQTRAVEFSWTATQGPHKVRVLVDEPFSSVKEATRENNRLSYEFTVVSPAAVRSATRQFAEAFGEALEQSGKALKFELSGDALKLYSDTLTALTNSAYALREVIEDTQLIKNTLPANIAQTDQIQRVDVITSVFDTMSEITLRMMGALSLGNFDGIIEQAGVLRSKLIELSTMNFEGIKFELLKPAILQMNKIIPLAKEFKEVLAGVKGRDLATVGRELFEAFLNYGSSLAQAGQGIKQAAMEQSARFVDKEGNPVATYQTGSLLSVVVANAHKLRLEVLNNAGAVLRDMQTESSKIDFDGMDGAGNAISDGTYFYKLSVQNTVIATNELGRLIVSPK
jgi:hypothetical protein